jgi:hypothetical protein
VPWPASIGGSRYSAPGPSFAAGAVAVCESGAAERRNGVLVSVTLATIHVRAEESGGLHHSHRFLARVSP